MKRARILLADDHTLLLEAFKGLLEPEYDVVGTVTDGRALLDTAAELKPDLVVCDITMPSLNGLDAGRQLKQLLPNVKLIYLTMNRDLDVVTEALHLGANGFVLKSSAAAELREAIKMALLGRTYVTPLITDHLDGILLQDPMRRKQVASLTPRQSEVLQLLADGKSMKEVAFILKVTPRTVAFHKYRMMEDLNIHSNAELFKFANRHEMT